MSDSHKKSRIPPPAVTPDREEALVPSTPEAFTGVPVWRESDERRGAEIRGDGGAVEDDENASWTTTTRRRGGGGGDDRDSFGPRERLALRFLAIAIAASAILPFFAVGDLWTSESRVNLLVEEEFAELKIATPEVALRGDAEEPDIVAEAEVEAESNTKTSQQQVTTGAAPLSGDGARPLTRNTFRPFLTDNDHAFINFYTSWCNHCKHLRPTWNELAAKVEAMRLPVAVGSVDCNAERKLCAEQNIAAFPTLRWYKGGRADARDYKMDRTVEAFVEFVEGKMTNVDEFSSLVDSSDEASVERMVEEAAASLLGEGARPLTRSTLRPFIRESKRAVIAFYAPWCQMCRRLRPLMDELAAEMKETGLPVAVGHVECDADWTLCSGANVVSIPTLRWYEGTSKITANYMMEWPVEKFVEFAKGRIAKEDDISSIPVLPDSTRKNVLVDEGKEDADEVEEDTEKSKDSSDAPREEGGGGDSRESSKSKEANGDWRDGAKLRAPDGEATTTEVKAEGGGDVSKSSPSNAAPAASSGEGGTNTPAADPLLKGTLSFNVELKRHILRGMWNYENSTAFPPQRFELIRNLGPEEDPTVLPMDGEFHGSFSLSYYHTTSKGKRKEWSKVIPESGVKIVFKRKGDASEKKEFAVKGQGNNQFGVFEIVGTATKSTHEGDPTFNMELRKKYISSPSAPPVGTGSGKEKKKEDSVHDASSLSEDSARPLTRSTFRQFLEESKHAFVDFDTPWCVWCQRLRPTWGKLAAEVEARGLPVVIGSVDCVAEKELCVEERIMAFPTLRWYDAGRVVSPDYKMDRTVEAFMGYAERRIAYAMAAHDKATLARLDEIQDLFAEARLSIEDCADSVGSADFGELAERAREAVEEAVTASELLRREVDDERMEWVNIEQLKRDLELVLVRGH